MEFKVISSDFHLLKSLYKEILKCFPKDSLQSLEKLQDALSDTQICAILNHSDSHTANKMILDCLINKMKFREDMFDLCDQLDKLTDITPDLKCLTDELRKGYIKLCIIMCTFIPVCSYRCKYSFKETSSQKEIAVICNYVYHTPACIN